MATPGRPGTNEASISGIPDGVRGVTLELSHPFAGGAAIAVPLAQADTGWTGEVALPFTGDWEVTALVRVDSFTQARGTCAFTVAP